MTAWRVSPFRDMRVWDSTGSGRIHFDSADIGEPLLGWIVENRVIQFALLERARQLPAVDPAVRRRWTAHSPWIMTAGKYN